MQRSLRRLVLVLLPGCGVLLAACGGGSDPDPVAAERELRRATGLFQQGQWPEAEAALERAVELDPTDAQAHLQLGYARLQQTIIQLGAISIDRERLDGALEALDRAIELEPTNPRAHFYRGMALERELDFDAAERAFLRSAELDPSSGSTFVRIGVTRLRSGRYPGAAEALTEALRLEPNRPDAHYQLGIVRQETGEWAASLESLDRAVQAMPGHAQAHFARSNSLRRLGRLDEAEAALARFRELAGVEKR